MASELTPMPQQLITQPAQATADAIASVLTARTASISLPIYDELPRCIPLFPHLSPYPGELVPPQPHTARQ